MCEIIFRGKRKDNSDWIVGYYAVQSNHACFAHELKYTHFIFKDIFLDFNLGGLQELEVIPETVGQYTGLTDKNGKKIFEGDIVHYVYEAGEGYWNINQNGVIKWKSTGFYLDGIQGTNKYALTSGWLISIPYSDNCKIDNFEVIGNIYDNPELLEVK